MTDKKTSFSDVLKDTLGPIGTVLAWARDHWGSRFLIGIMVGIMIGIGVTTFHPASSVFKKMFSFLGSEYERPIDWDAITSPPLLLEAQKRLLEEESTHVTGQTQLQGIFSYAIDKPKRFAYFILSTTDSSYNIKAWLYVQRKFEGSYSLTPVKIRAATGNRIEFEVPPTEEGDLILSVIAIKSDSKMTETKILKLLDTKVDHPKTGGT